ncbi:MAG: hypothetical protein DRG73_10890 [Deltaproteobacteria bacterium]|nr:MAG: hypothetical protein DRG73_10890 [Deltaproteobacteria bacterium]
MSGKGGVGKSAVAATRIRYHLAISL